MSADPAGIVQGNFYDLEEVATEASYFARTNRPAEADKQHVQALGATLSTMLDKVLAAKKRPRDMAKVRDMTGKKTYSFWFSPPAAATPDHAWRTVCLSALSQQEDYQTTMTGVLLASNSIMNLQHRLRWPLPNIAHIIPKVATAMEEVTRLLRAHKQQQQHQAGPSQRTQKRQLHKLQDLAEALLLWCLAGGGTIILWRDSVNSASMQLRAVELAAALANSLTPTQTLPCYPETVLRVLDR